jgi:23S rRNA (cytidine1920-2'-O)/16S rRNA (cytidine1409-2'-O)-methyltransferase
MKIRIDRLLVQRGLAETREKAQAMIMTGNVLVDNIPATKAGMVVAETANISLKEAPHPYVSRGGLKLEGALGWFGLNAENQVCLDVGASTGGFTHCLLLNGARRVYALDVDVKQLAWSLRSDPRVRTIELNARFLEPAHIGETVDMVTIDAAFISLTLLLPRIPAVLCTGGYCLALVKPQFEVGRDMVGRGGIVNDPELHRQSVRRIENAGIASGLDYVGSCESPITGREGNREFFVLFKKA